MWNIISIPMKSVTIVNLMKFSQNRLVDVLAIKEIIHIFNDYYTLLIEVISQSMKMLDADYSKMYINNVIEEYSYLSHKEKHKLKYLFYK